jgi:hypothetical protein
VISWFQNSLFKLNLYCYSVARGSCVAAMRVCETCADVMANGGMAAAVKLTD